MRSVCEPIFEKPLQDISFGLLLLQLFRTAGRFNMELQPSLVLLQKTMVNVEGLGKELYPELDLWQTALPFLEAWQKKRLSPWENLKKLKDKFPELLEQLPELPELVYDFLSDTRAYRRQAGHMMQEQTKSRLQFRTLQSQKRCRFGIGTLLLTGLIMFTDLGGWMDTIPLEVWLLSFSGIGLLYFRR